MEAEIKNAEYLGIEEKLSVAGKKFTVLTLADPVKYEKLEFFIGHEFHVPTGLAMRTNVDAVVDIQKDRKGTSIWLRSVVPSKQLHKVVGQ